VQACNNVVNALVLCNNPYGMLLVIALIGVPHASREAE